MIGLKHVGDLKLVHFKSKRFTICFIIWTTVYALSNSLLGKHLFVL